MSARPPRQDHGLERIEQDQQDAEDSGECGEHVHRALKMHRVSRKRQANREPELSTLG